MDEVTTDVPVSVARVEDVGNYPNWKKHPEFMDTVSENAFKIVLLKQLETNEMVLREILATLKASQSFKRDNIPNGR